MSQSHSAITPGPSRFPGGCSESTHAVEWQIPVIFRAMRTALIALALALFAAAVSGQESTTASGPPGPRNVMPASDEAAAAMKSFKVPPGFKVELFAAEPDVANISSFDMAPDGSAYIVEVFRRRGGGVLDMR